ncbi:MAG TPA: hypothetical protein VGD59_10530 [Acidisarcina sp.]
MRTLDRVFGCLMIVGALGHAMGSYAAYKTQAMALLWALSASFAELLLAALNLLRAGRPGDGKLAAVTLAGNLAQMVLVYTFGRLIGNVFDFRVLIQGGVTLVLIIMSVRTLSGISHERKAYATTSASSVSEQVRESPAQGS